MPAAPGREDSRFLFALPPVADTSPPEISMSWPGPYTPPPIPAAPSPPTAFTVPPVISMFPAPLSFFPPMPAPPPSPPSAVREPLVSLSSLMVSLPEDSLPFFSRPAFLPPLFSSLSPSSSMVASWPPLTVTAALLSRTGLSPPPSTSALSLPSTSVLSLTSPSALPLPSTSALPLTSIFRSSKVTSTLPLEVSMVTVCSFDSPVMTVSPSSFLNSLSPCLTSL